MPSPKPFGVGATEPAGHSPHASVARAVMVPTAHRAQLRAPVALPSTGAVVLPGRQATHEVVPAAPVLKRPAAHASQCVAPDALPPVELPAGQAVIATDCLLLGKYLVPTLLLLEQQFQVQVESVDKALPFLEPLLILLARWLCLVFWLEIIISAVRLQLLQEQMFQERVVLVDNH